MDTNSVADNSVLIIIRGLPGSGKSYIAKELQSQLGVDRIILLDPDMTDYEGNEYKQFSSKLNGEGVDIKLHPYRFLRSKAYQAISNHKIMAWNQAFTHLDLLDRTIKNLQNYAQENGVELKVVVVEVEIDLQTAKARVADRASAGGHNVDDETFDRFFNDYKTFSDYGYRTIAVDGKVNAANTAALIISEINKI